MSSRNHRKKQDRKYFSLKNKPVFRDEEFVPFWALKKSAGFNPLGLFSLFGKAKGAKNFLRFSPGKSLRASFLDDLARHSDEIHQGLARFSAPSAQGIGRFSAATHVPRMGATERIGKAGLQLGSGISEEARALDDLLEISSFLSGLNRNAVRSGELSGHLATAWNSLPEAIRNLYLRSGNIFQSSRYNDYERARYIMRALANEHFSKALGNKSWFGKLWNNPTYLINRAADVETDRLFFSAVGDLARYRDRLDEAYKLWDTALPYARKWFFADKGRLYSQYRPFLSDDNASWLRDAAYRVGIFTSPHVKAGITQRMFPMFLFGGINTLSDASTIDPDDPDYWSKLGQRALINTALAAPLILTPYAVPGIGLSGLTNLGRAVTATAQGLSSAYQRGSMAEMFLDTLAQADQMLGDRGTGLGEEWLKYSQSLPWWQRPILTTAAGIASSPRLLTALSRATPRAVGWPLGFVTRPVASIGQYGDELFGHLVSPHPFWASLVGGNPVFGGRAFHAATALPLAPMYLLSWSPKLTLPILAGSTGLGYLSSNPDKLIGTTEWLDRSLGTDPSQHRNTFTSAVLSYGIGSILDPETKQAIEDKLRSYAISVAARHRNFGYNPETNQFELTSNQVVQELAKEIVNSLAEHGKLPNMNEQATEDLLNQIKSIYPNYDRAGPQEKQQIWATVLHSLGRSVGGKSDPFSPTLLSSAVSSLGDDRVAEKVIEPIMNNPTVKNMIGNTFGIRFNQDGTIDLSSVMSSPYGKSIISQYLSSNPLIGGIVSVVDSVLGWMGINPDTIDPLSKIMLLGIPIGGLAATGISPAISGLAVMLPGVIALLNLLSSNKNVAVPPDNTQQTPGTTTSPDTQQTPGQQPQTPGQPASPPANTWSAFNSRNPLGWYGTLTNQYGLFSRPLA